MNIRTSKVSTRCSAHTMHRIMILSIRICRINFRIDRSILILLRHQMERILISVIRRHDSHIRIDRGILILLCHQMERILISVIRGNFLHIIFKLIILRNNSHTMPSIFMLSGSRHGNHILLITNDPIGIKSFTSKDARNRLIFKSTFTCSSKVCISVMRIIQIDISLIHSLTIINLILPKHMLIIGIINTSICKSSINRFHIHIDSNSISCIFIWMKILNFHRIPIYFILIFR